MAWSEGRRRSAAAWRCSTFTIWTQWNHWTLAITWWSWWQHYKYRPDYYTPPLIGGCIKRCFCWRLSDVWRLSRTSGLSREQRGLGRSNWHRGSPCYTWLGHYFQGQKVKGQGHQAPLVGYSSHYIIMNFHGARRVGRRRRKVCKLWTGGGLQRAYSGRWGDIVSPRAQLVIIKLPPVPKSDAEIDIVIIRLNLPSSLLGHNLKL